MAEREAKDVVFNVRLDRATHKRLARLARKHERSIVGELRLALKRYLEQHDEAAA